MYELFLPFQQFFAAIFFVAFGMRIDYHAFLEVVQVGLVFVGVALIGKTLAGFVAGRWQGLSVPASLNIGFAMVAKGEFSIILAGVAASVARPEIHLEALIAFFVLLMSIIGPVLMKESGRIATVALRLSKHFGRSPEEKGYEL